MDRSHYWLVADVDGRVTLIYGGPDEGTARQKGLEMLPGINFDVKRLPTTNLQRASAMLKGHRLERTHDIRRATERLQHDGGLRRAMQRRQRQRRYGFNDR